MPKVTANVSVPLTFDVEMDHGDKVLEVVEKFIVNRLPHGCDIDGEIDIHSLHCDEIEDLGEDDTMYQCESCHDWVTDDGLCPACQKEQDDYQKVKEETQRWVNKAQALVSAPVAVFSPVEDKPTRLDDYLQTFSVTADAAKTTKME